MTIRKRMAVGFGAGVVGTIAMSIPMIAATATGISPMPKPIPAAVIGVLFGPGLTKPLLMLLAAGSHLFYGGAWGAAFAVLRKRVTVWSGLGLGIGLWLIMQVVVLPALGWGAFGSAITPKIAVATLILHLIYGATTGYALQRITNRESFKNPPGATIHA
jgi:formate/nitrite transporter FocA (FNT family)